MADNNPLRSSVFPGISKHTLTSKSVTTSPNFALYISALAGILAAFYATDGVVGNTALSVITTALAVIGTLFAMAYRQARLPAAPVTWFITLTIAVLILAISAGWINLTRLLGDYTEQGDLNLAVIIQCMTAAYTFAMVDDKRILMSSIISMAMIGLVATYSVNGDLIIAFLVYMVSTTFLLLHQSYLMFSVWGLTTLTRKQSRMLLRSQLTFAVVGAILSLVLGTFLVIPLQAIGSHLSLGSALKGLANFEPGSQATAEVQQDVAAELDNDSSTFEIGQGPTSDEASHTTLMVMDASDHQDHYWRGRTFDHYTGTSWVSTLKDGYIDAAGPIFKAPLNWYHLGSDSADGGTDIKNYGSPVRIRVQVNNYSTSTLYVPQNTYWIGFPLPMRTPCRMYNDGSISMATPASKFTFDVVCRPSDASPMQLMRDSSAQIAPSIRHMYIDQQGDNVLPSDSARFRSTVQSIINAIPLSRRNEFTKVEAIRDWVAARCLYSLDVDPTPDGQDAVANFLFNTHEGYCDLFASSMALMCRYAGIPARVATGFDPGLRRAFVGSFVTSSDRHAWCEVFFPGYGWQTFDPTAGTRIAPARSHSFSLWTWLKSSSVALVAAMKSGGTPIIILTIAIIGALVLIVRNEVLPKLRKLGAHNRFGSITKTDQRGLKSLEERSESAKLAAINRWSTVKMHSEKWRRKQDEGETCTEFTQMLTSAMSIAAQINERKPGDDIYESKMVVSSVHRLSKDYLTAKYANDSLSDEALMGRNENGSAEGDLRVIADAARLMKKPRKSAVFQEAERYVYVANQLSNDPMEPLNNIDSDVALKS